MVGGRDGSSSEGRGEGEDEALSRSEPPPPPKKGKKGRPIPEEWEELKQAKEEGAEGKQRRRKGKGQGSRDELAREVIKVDWGTNETKRTERRSVSVVRLITRNAKKGWVRLTRNSSSQRHSSLIQRQPFPFARGRNDHFHSRFRIHDGSVGLSVRDLSVHGVEAEDVGSWDEREGNETQVSSSLDASSFFPLPPFLSLCPSPETKTLKPTHPYR